MGPRSLPRYAARPMVLRSLFCFALLTSCGARTGLPSPDEGGGGQGTGANGGGGSLPGGGGQGGAGGDGGTGGEGGFVPECDPETTQYIYLVTNDGELYSYYPATGAFTFRGFLDCPASFDTSPFSMGVDRQGTAYVVYTDGNLYRVSTLDASCEATDFIPGQAGFFTFGMGFALDEVGGTEDKLFVAEISFNGPSLGLATIDTETLELEYLGPFSENPSDRIEMTSSSDGNLYGFFLNNVGTGGWVVEIDKTSAAIVESTFIQAGSGPSALAFAWWGGDYYVFTGNDDEGTNVTRYDPDTGSVNVITSLGSVVVGAGVSTCAPGAL